MENKNLKNQVNRAISAHENNRISYIEKKFTEMNSELAVIYDSTLKEDNDNNDISNIPKH